MKKMLSLVLVLVMGVLVVNQVNLQKENNKLEEEKLVNPEDFAYNMIPDGAIAFDFITAIL